MPLKIPVIIPKKRITGLIISIGSILLTNKRYARNSCVILWARAPKKLTVIGLASLPNNSLVTHMTNVCPG
jgi:hypothetical protein